MTEVYFFDTNILMYAVGSAHPLKAPCQQLLEKVAKGDIIAVTDTEVFQEIAYRYWSQNKWDIAIQVLKDYQSLFEEIYAVEAKHLLLYYEILSHYTHLSPRDAIHIAIAKAHKIKNIYTADRDFKKVSGLKIFFPE